ncbi:MAG: Gfo/Idh/MocA family oxidoreductase [Clostridia bacterium]|nr:Gfo/Idh/MocA family oxidoreductase [Clostridia bacterium]
MKKISAMVVGCGDRATVYATEGCKNLKNMKITACVDPDISKLEMMKREFGVPADNCFASVEEAAARGKICDCVINGTMDRLHVSTTLPLLELGYDVLLEKPVCNNEKDLLALRDAAEKNGCRLFICHVLRYSPFYRKIKEVILSGEIGNIVHINTYEHVGVFLTSVSFVRGKWSKQSECGSSLLLAKCCHDIDLICWLNNDTTPDTVYSDGGRNFLIPENAPEGSGTRCLVDCPAKIREKCIFDAKPMYLDNCLLPWYPWQCTGRDYREITDEEKESSLKTYNPHGLCAYKCGGDIADHQTVSVRFKNGSYATHSVTLSSFRDGRDIFIAGTEGEIDGRLDDGKITVRHYDRKTSWYNSRVIDVNEDEETAGQHYGGDRGLVKDFVNTVAGGRTSISATTINDSVNGHILVFRADESMKKGVPVKFDKSGD